MNCLEPLRLATTKAPRRLDRSFWPRILNDEALRDCGNLEKLIAGCEMIVVLDELGLLAA
ncbi:MAG: hypothetical protein ABI795_08105 [Chthoniobacterales bacterium]